MKNIREFIAEKFGGGSWEQITAGMQKDGEIIILFKFDKTIVFEGENVHCVIISEEKIDLDGNFLEANDIYELYI